MPAIGLRETIARKKLAIQKNFRLSADDAEKLELISLRHHVNESDVLRHLIDEEWRSIGPRELKTLRRMKQQREVLFPVRPTRRP
jgi:hypothetical protein